MSGFAGVYFELLLKSASTSLWIKNIQFALYGAAISGASVCLFDDAVVTKGFFYGYNRYRDDASAVCSCNAERRGW